MTEKDKSKQSEIKTVIFDVDQTLTNFVSWTRLTQSLGASVEDHLSFFTDYVNDVTTLDDALNSIVKMWKATGNANKKKFAEILKEWAPKDDASETVKYLKKKYEVIIISGAVEDYIRLLSKVLDIGKYYSVNKMIWNKSGHLKSMEYHSYKEKPKLKLLKKYLKEKNLEFINCAMVGDGENDIEIFEKVGMSILVENGRNNGLEKLTDHKIKDLAEIKNYL